MEKQKFNVTINAPRQRVWDVLWGDESYRNWTSVFSEGSTVKTDWKKGSKVLFLDGKGSGMVSRIADLKPNEFMSFEHVGMVENGVERTEGEDIKKWAGSHENYTLRSHGDKTDLEVEMDVNDDYKDYFVNTFPKALEKVKQLSEQKEMAN